MMDAGTLRGVFTLIMLLLFVGVCFWAYSSRRRKDFDEAAQLPLQGDEGSIPSSNQDGRQ